ncbi:MAG: hypothetical protein HOP28_05000 [Gemmatimonadales bacterium]|nr:hypothetical protein [Gemmatimonadales bacterium]
MRIAHLADLHLGFRQYHRQTSGGINQREADVANAFRAAAAGVIEARPDAIILAGDLFHAVRPSNHSIVFAFRQLQLIREALPNTPIILIAGNHDTPRSSDTGSILQLFEELGVSIAADAARRLTFPALDLSVLAVPHAAWFGAEPLVLRPEGPEKHQVLVLHGEVEGLFPSDRTSVEYGGVVFDAATLECERWSYVALGHYHVQHEVAKNIWYSGALEYVSPNPWGELADEARHKIRGKGWLLADLDAGRVTRVPVAAGRPIFDLPRVDGEGLSAALLDQAIAARLAEIPGGIADTIVRLVVENVPRHISRDLDHAALRAAKAQALHFQLDLRRPESASERGNAAPGGRKTLPEVVGEFLARRPLPERVDRARFVSTGLDVLAEAAEAADGEPL